MYYFFKDKNLNKNLKKLKLLLVAIAIYYVFMNLIIYKVLVYASILIVGNKQKPQLLLLSAGKYLNIKNIKIVS